MSVIAIPSGLNVNAQPFEQIRNDLNFRSIFGAQSVEVAGPLWATSLTAPTVRDSATESGLWKALLMQLRGRTNQLAVHDFGRPVPRGTMRGTMTLNSGAAQGATSLSIIAAGEVSKTLVKGDMLGLGSGTTQQVVMVVADAVSDGSGIIAATIEPALRNAHLAAASVAWDKPCALFRRRESGSRWEYKPGGVVQGYMVDLIEDWRA